MADIDISSAGWSEHGERLSALRREVFIEEQSVPEQLEWDGCDEDAMHFIALSGGQIVGCARLIDTGKVSGRVGRMAVKKTHRGRGIGAAMLEYIIHYANRSHYNRLHLHAQVSAIGFYEKAGFRCTGELFYEAGIPHREMQLDLG